MYQKPYIIFVIFCLIFLLNPTAAKSFEAPEKRCFITKPNACIFRSTLGNFGLDLSNEYSMQELLAEIAVKYAQTGDMKKAKLIAEALTLETSKADALSSIDKLPQQPKRTFVIRKISNQQKQQLLEEAKSFLNAAPAFRKEEYKVRVALIISEFGLFKEADSLIETMKDKVFRAVTLIGIADLYISLNQMDLAQLKLAQAMELALSLECNVSPCSGNSSERLARPQKPRL